MSAINYQKILKYEVARELLNGRIAVLSELIATEERKSSPDMRVVEEMEEAILVIGGEIHALDVTNEAALDASIAANSRPPC